ncbi:polysaccharide biosynthesis protein [Gammaproteobacteria bacterium]|nr:polysaccharide biosynthesis protein [Gammaproteobacteria bacterium]
MRSKTIRNTLKNLTRRNKLILLIFTDCVIAFICWVVFGPPFSFMIASNFESSLYQIIQSNILSFIVPFFFTFFYFVWSDFYRSLMKFFDSKDSIFRALIGSLIFGSFWGISYLSQYEIIKTDYLSTVILQAFLLSAVFYAFLQISRDIAQLIIYPKNERFNGKPVLIYGAGSAGNELYQAIKVNSAIRVIGFYDNSPNLSGAEINNIKIYSKQKHIKKLSEKYPGMEIYLAIPSLSTDERRKIISSLESYKIAIRSMPALHDIVEDEKALLQIQELSIDEILPRKVVRRSDVRFDNKTILITGAGGSIGSEIVRQILRGNPKKIVLFELSEINLYSIESEVNAIKKSKNILTEVIAILGDVKNKKRVSEVLQRHSVDTIYHAAAYKHVPIVEYFENITEGIKNNIFGTKSVCDAAIENNIYKVVVVSTDKAVRPTNVMGASKRFAEMIVQSINDLNQDHIFCMVRFGNVLNSSGSVIPLFRKQISEGGPITLTDKRVTRFFMTITEASSLVIQAGEFAKGGDVFILDMGEQVKILDLAEKLIYLSGRNIKQEIKGEGIEIQEVGLRPGEKLFEELLISGAEIKTSNEKVFKSNEKFLSKDELDNAVNDLKKAIDENDHLKIKEIFKNTVEGYSTKG